MVAQDTATRLKKPQELFKMLDDYQIDATLMRTESGASRLLAHVDGWEKAYTDDIATLYLRKTGAVHGAEPAVTPTAN